MRTFTIDEYEHQFVSCIAQDPSCLKTIDIHPKQLKNTESQMVFSAIKKLIENGKTLDLFYLAEYLGFEGVPAKDCASLASGLLKNHEVSVQNIRDLEEEIKRNCRQRQVQTVAHKFYQDSLTDPDFALSSVMRHIQSIDDTQGVHLASVSEIFPDVVDRIKALARGGVAPGVTSGLADLDNLLGHFQPSNLVVLAARPGIGKTALMCNFALDAKCPIGIISAEQSKEQLTERFISNRLAIPVNKIRLGRVGGDIWNKLNPDIFCKDIDIHIFDRSSPSIDEVENVARKMVWNHDIKILFVDYLQLLRSNQGEKRYQQVGDISRRLKGISKEFQMPVVALAQLNRNTEGRTPTMADLRDSGDIEQDADQIILLHRNETDLDLLVCKNRHGPVGKVKAIWMPDKMKIGSAA